MTIVEYLEEKIIRFHNWKLNPIYDENCFDEIELDKAIKQAKEMEKHSYICSKCKSQINGNEVVQQMQD